MSPHAGRPRRAAFLAVALAASPWCARAQDRAVEGLPEPTLPLLGLPAPIPDAGAPAPVELPRDVAAFLRRRAGCQHLIDGGDPDRVAESVRARFRLKCATLEDEERRLRARYAAAPAVVEILDQADAAE